MQALTSILQDSMLINRVMILTLIFTCAGIFSKVSLCSQGVGEMCRYAVLALQSLVALLAEIAPAR